MEIASGVYSIAESTGGYVKGAYVHAFLIDDGDELTLIDTLHDVRARAILAQIQAIGKTPSDIKRIILTHGHRSHLGGMRVLKQLSGAPIYAHEWEADIISGDRAPQPTTLLPVKPVRTWPLQVGLLFAKHPACPVDQTLRDGERVGPLQVIHTPGHTPGHLAFFWPERSVLFAGDALVNWPEFGPAWPGFALNQKQVWASVRRMAQLNAQGLALGHGDPITSGGAELLRALASGERGAGK